MPRKFIHIDRATLIAFATGFFAGLPFSLTALLLQAFLDYGSPHMGALASVHAAHPVLWFIDAIPFITGGLGLRRYRRGREIEARIADLEQSLDEQTAVVEAHADTARPSGNNEGSPPDRLMTERNTRIMSILDAATQYAILVTDIDGVIMTFNVGAELMFGYTADEVVGKATPIILHDMDEVRERTRQANGAPPQSDESLLKSLAEHHRCGQWTCRRKDGSRLTVQLEISPICTEAGTTIGYLAIVRDISEQRAAEEDLHMLSEAVEQSPISVAIVDSDKNYRYVNRQYCLSAGYAAEELIGMSAPDMKVGQISQDLEKAIKATLERNNTWTGIVECLNRDGERYWERRTISAINNTTGSVSAYLMAGLDITTELMTQHKLAETDKLSAIGVLAAGVAHEFKNYLGGIIGNASYLLDLAEQGAEAEELTETLGKIISIGERANEVAMSLLSYSRERPGERERQSLLPIITHTLRLVEKEMKHRSIELITYFDDTPPVAVAAGKIQQVLLNLIINAGHAIGSDGVITLAVLNMGDAIYINVGDSGEGIPPDIMSRIFDPFFSTKGVWGKDAVVGSGMGLALGRNIAREHGGELSVESIVGAGTTFTLSLPLAATEPAAPQRIRNPRKYRILVFTYDFSIKSGYFAQSHEENIRVIFKDDITGFADIITQIADVAVCDAAFCGKVELLELIALCQRLGMPYVLINCFSLENQFDDISDRALVCYDRVPDMKTMVSEAISARSSTLPTPD